MTLAGQRVAWFCAALLFLTSVSQAAVPRQRIGIIGGGGAGLATAWLLEGAHDVTLLEKNSRLGGHADTVYLDLDGYRIPMEVGFEFFNRNLYPHFLKLLKHLRVEINPYSMNYSFWRKDRDEVTLLPPFYPDGGSNPALVDLGYLVRMIQFNMFVTRAKNLVSGPRVPARLSDFVDTISIQGWFKNEFLYPFLASMWGVSPTEIRSFTAYPVAQWMALNATNGVMPPEFLEVRRGLASYIAAEASELRHTQVHLNSEVVSITRAADVFTVTTRQGRRYEFDQIVMATGGDAAGWLLRDVIEVRGLQRIMASMEYFSTAIAIHGDDRWMPPRRSDWGIVNIAYDGRRSAITVHKPWKSSSRRLYKSWVTFEVANGLELPSPLYAMHQFRHPKLTKPYYDVQSSLENGWQGYKGVWYAGMYTQGLDDHETAITSAMRIAERLAPDSARLAILK